MKVKYLGASRAQANWGGCDDPRALLTVGEVYEVESREVHAWHTKVFLVLFQARGSTVYVSRTHKPK